ncbi:hypothetical protein ZIOFF_037238 [Zingiber officinale]|uniref:Uncharacterized protein n=1 Tax=Zingiber officinale TaxID=94328 RepID=A0A8J5GFM3_ZINOF|nr:hypothetical protein ZIOFF_037238 [Zingiber officinale]
MINPQQMRIIKLRLRGSLSRIPSTFPLTDVHRQAVLAADASAKSAGAVAFCTSSRCTPAAAHLSSALWLLLIGSPLAVEVLAARCDEVEGDKTQEGVYVWPPPDTQETKAFDRNVNAYVAHINSRR